MPIIIATNPNKTNISKGIKRVIWGLDLHSWEQLMVGTLFAAGVVAIGVAVTTACVVILTREENKHTKIEYESYKLTVEGKVSDAKREGIEAGKSASDALLRAAELEKQAAELKSENLALEAKIQPRRLSSEQIQKMVGILSKQPLSIAIVSRIMDAEGKDFADDLTSTFSSAKWNVLQFSNWLKSDKGVFIAAVEETIIPPDVENTISAALESANIAHKTITIVGDDISRMSPHFQSNVLYLLIGVKP